MAGLHATPVQGALSGVEAEAAAILRQFRDRLGDRVTAPARRAMARRLEESSPDFRRLWRALAVAPPRPGRPP
ncbi:hypothetical protein AB0958_05660 [Streptomyces sp. NPDC006655]|uniref:MmyB family transcriptional regulator n=1 Tax=Streptomyces sp. NPDC006655 TaxID=3156898 RepID=UPI003456669B